MGIWKAKGLMKNVQGKVDWDHQEASEEKFQR